MYRAGFDAQLTSCSIIRYAPQSVCLGAYFVNLNNNPQIIMNNSASQALLVIAAISALIVMLITETKYVAIAIACFVVLLATFGYTNEVLDRIRKLQYRNIELYSAMIAVAVTGLLGYGLIWPYPFASALGCMTVLGTIILMIQWANSRRSYFAFLRRLGLPALAVDAVGGLFMASIALLCGSLSIIMSGLSFAF